MRNIGPINHDVGLGPWITTQRRAFITHVGAWFDRTLWHILGRRH